MGALGPMRVCFEKEGQVPASPAELVNNTESWIEFTDLVFVDPVGTGFSQVLSTTTNSPSTPGASGSSETKPSDDSQKVDEKEFYQNNKDLDSICEFIVRFLNQHRLWDQPLWICGESYGGIS